MRIYKPPTPNIQIKGKEVAEIGKYCRIYCIHYSSHTGPLFLIFEIYFPQLTQITIHRVFIKVGRNGIYSKVFPKKYFFIYMMNMIPLSETLLRNYHCNKTGRVVLLHDFCLVLCF